MLSHGYSHTHTHTHTDGLMSPGHRKLLSARSRFPVGLFLTSPVPRGVNSLHIAIRGAGEVKEFAQRLHSFGTLMTAHVQDGAGASGSSLWQSPRLRAASHGHTKCPSSSGRSLLYKHHPGPRAEMSGPGAFCLHLLPTDPCLVLL